MQTEGLIMNKHRQTHERSYKAWRDMQFMMTGMQGGFKLLPGQTETGWIWYAGQTYPKLFHLFFLQARGVKIEAWLKDKFRGQGRGGDKTM